MRLVLLVCALAACLGCGRGVQGSSERDQGTLPPGTAVVTGTTLDAASGRTLAGVVVTGPNGTSAVSDENGRFTLRGLPTGVEGELAARSKDGLEARNRLRPLRNERLEVVLHLRSP